MKNNQGRSLPIIAIILALIIGFSTGVIVTAYMAPSIVAQLPQPQQNPQAQQNGPTEKELEGHIKHLEAELGKNDQNGKMWIELGNAYFDAQATDKAINAYLKALALSPDNPDVLTDLGVLYRRNKQYEKAVEAFNKAASIAPAHIQSRFNKGVILFHDLKDKEGAIKAWQEVAKLQPDYTVSTGQTIQQLLERVQ